MIASFRHFLGWLVSSFSSRADLVLENLVLRRQLLALHAQRPRRRLTALHKLFWVALRTFWSGWRKPLVLVTPRTVVNWHRAGFRLYWTWVSRVERRNGIWNWARFFIRFSYTPVCVSGQHPDLSNSRHRSANPQPRSRDDGLPRFPQFEGEQEK